MKPFSQAITVQRIPSYLPFHLNFTFYQLESDLSSFTRESKLYHPNQILYPSWLLRGKSYKQVFNTSHPFSHLKAKVHSLKLTQSLWKMVVGSWEFTGLQPTTEGFSPCLKLPPRVGEAKVHGVAARCVHWPLPNGSSYPCVVPS